MKQIKAGERIDIETGESADVWAGGSADVRDGGSADVRDGGRAVVRDGGRADVRAGGSADVWDGGEVGGDGLVVDLRGGKWAAPTDNGTALFQLIFVTPKDGIRRLRYGCAVHPVTEWLECMDDICEAHRGAMGDAAVYAAWLREVIAKDAAEVKA